MHPTRPSATAAFVAYARGLETLRRHPIVEDHVAEQLLPQPFRLALGLIRRTRAVWGFLPDIWPNLPGHGMHVPLRTRAIDDAIREAVRDGATQLVLLGAGLDGRAWRMSELADVEVFEVDHPATQAYKRARAADLALMAKHVHFVSVDFERDVLGKALQRAGFAPSARTIFIWEGVTMYLSQDAIGETLRTLRELASPDSILALTYGRKAKRWHRSLNRFGAFVRLMGEPFKQLFTAEEVSQVLEEHGFRIIDDHGDIDWSPRYLGRASGDFPEHLVRARALPPH